MICMFCNVCVARNYIDFSRDTNHIANFMLLYLIQKCPQINSVWLIKIALQFDSLVIQRLRTIANCCSLWLNDEIKEKSIFFSNILQAMTIRSNCRDLLIKVIQSLAKVTAINSQVNIHWKWKSKKRTIASLIHIAVKLENCADLLCQLYRHHSQYLPIAKLANKWNHAKLHSLTKWMEEMIKTSSKFCMWFDFFFIFIFKVYFWQNTYTVWICYNYINIDFFIVFFFALDEFFSFAWSINKLVHVNEHHFQHKRKLVIKHIRNKWLCEFIRYNFL